MAPTDLTIELLTSIRDEAREFRQEVRAQLGETNQRLDQTNDRLDQTNDRLDQTNERLGETTQRLDHRYDVATHKGCPFRFADLDGGHDRNEDLPAAVRALRVDTNPLLFYLD